MNKSVNIPTRKLSKIGFGYRGNPLFYSTHILHDKSNNSITFYHYPNLLAKLYISLALPFIILIDGLAKTKESLKDYTSLMRQSPANLNLCRKDTIYFKENKDNTLYNQVLAIIYK